MSIFYFYLNFNIIFPEFNAKEELNLIIDLIDIILIIIKCIPGPVATTVPMALASLAWLRMIPEAVVVLASNLLINTLFKVGINFLKEDILD